jgi:hypothetical protein
MGRGIAFTSSEDDFLATNAEDKTAKELCEIHDELREDMMWPERSIKSLARRVERLRELGKVGKRSEETRRKAYYGRNRAIRGE